MAEQGDVQMCTTMANVAKGQLLSGEDEEGRLERLSDAYLGEALKPAPSFSSSNHPNI